MFCRDVGFRDYINMPIPYTCLYMPLYAFISWGSMSQITKLSGAVKVLASLHVGACFPRSPRLLPSFVSCHLRIFSSGTGPGCVGPWNCLIWIPTITRTFLDLKSLDSGIVVGKRKSLQKLEKKKKTRKFQSRIMLSEPCWTSQESVKCLASLKLQHIQRTQKNAIIFCFVTYDSLLKVSAFFCYLQVMTWFSCRWPWVVVHSCCYQVRNHDMKKNAGNHRMI